MPGASPSGHVVVDWVRRHQVVLVRYLRALGAEGSHALDLAQEVFVAAWQRDVQDMGDAAAAAWLRETGRRMFLAAGRRAKGREASLDPVAVDEVWDPLQARDGGSAWREALDRCVKGLPERSRQLVEGRYGDGLSRDQLGQRLQLSDAGVKQALRRVRAALKDCVLERLGDDVPAAWKVGKGEGER